MDAYGFPVHELTRLWDLTIWPLRFVDQVLSKKVKRACHALAIDEERASFRPVLWKCDNPRIEQVWFAGVHSDVGGGYARSELALVSLDWMISKVEARSENDPRLRFVSHIRKDYAQRANCHGVQHDSRSGLRAYYRYQPRDIGRLGCEQCITQAQVHASVLKRVREKIVAYAPIAMPHKYDVVDDLGQKADRQEEYDSKTMEMAHAYVLRRSWLYAAYVLASLAFALFPLFLSNSPGDECTGWWCPAGAFLRLVACILPECIQPWIGGWIGVVESPWGLVAIIVTAVVLGKLKARWFSATRRHATAAWAALKKKGD